MAPTTGTNYVPVPSSVTNRRKMVSTEITKSLRRCLLWERSQSTLTANAVLKRRHTSLGIAKLRQDPEPVHMSQVNDDADLNKYLKRDALSGYHYRGW
jgi:hypothetical protein